MSTISSRGSIKARLEGRGLVTLRPADHIATGGEGSIYRVGTDTVAKIYTDPKHMQARGLPEKIAQLAKLKSPYVVAPTGLILSEKRDPIGYYMPYADGHPLSRVFTNEFWQRESFTKNHAKELVSRMRDTIMFAHKEHATLVDANELNWLMKFASKDPEPRVVDVDSWAIGKWRATAIMPSIRDWNAKTFDEKSDWFAWAVVTFQVFTGIHPYKGTHPTYKKNEFVERMKANASVFAPNVRLNQAVRDFSLIPKSLLGWYEAVFERGERTIPPSPLMTGTQVPTPIRTMRVVASNVTGLLVYEKLFERVNNPVIRTFQSGAVMLQSGMLVDVRAKRDIGPAKPDCEVARTPDGWLILEKENGKAVFRYAEVVSGNVETLPFSIQARHIFGVENRLFVLGESGLTEIKLHSFGRKVLVSAGQTWSTLPNSTTLYDGVGIQDAMGAMFAVLPIGDAGMTHIRIRELDGRKVVAAKAGKRFAAFVTLDKSGVYQRVELIFEKDYTSYRAEFVSADNAELNLAILPKGVAASIVDDGEVVISVPSNGAVTKIEDKYLSTNMILGNFADQVIYIENGAVWSLRMK